MAKSSSRKAEGTKTDNTVTVEEDVTNEKGKRDVDIILDGVNVDTSTQTEALPDTGSTGDKTIIKVGEGADVDLTVQEFQPDHRRHGIDIGVNLEDKDENKGADVDLTLDNTKVNLTQNGKVGINVQDNSNVDLTLKGENAIDGSKAIENEDLKKNVNVEGIRVGGGGAGDGSGASEGAKNAPDYQRRCRKDRNCGSRHRRNGKPRWRLTDHQ